jgi:hypothetical protein
MEHNMVFTLGCGQQKKVNNAKQYTNFAGNFYCHGDVAIQCGAHCPMEHILGFTRSHWMLQLGKCMGRIPPVAAMVNNFE